ncbi:MAG: phage major capsid protein [Clostridia bacterium]|nr:phage major capsid protein [Clostridia bacterium]
MPAFNITDARENIRNIQNQIDQARAQARQMIANPNATAAEMDAHAATIQQLTARLNLAQQELQHGESAAAAQLTPNAGQLNALEESRLRNMLRSNEYARSFADAIRNGVTLKSGRGVEKYNVLYDALTISGGDTPGEDGGFLVPEDVDHQIMEQRRALNPLASLFNEESVTANSGWRVMDSAPTKGMTAVDEMGEIPNDDQPGFVKVPYKLTKYALWIPCSNELASDEVANLFAYLSRWFARKAVITENNLLLAALQSLTAQDVAAGEEMKGIKNALNVALDPTIALTSVIVTNQTGFNVLDNLEDKTGRPLLNPDPKTGTPKMSNGRAVHVISDAVLKSEEDKAPLYIGDMKQFATLFRRNPLEIASTNVGGSAWRTDSIEVRGIQRMGTSKFDAAAAVKRMLPV